MDCRQRKYPWITPLIHGVDPAVSLVMRRRTIDRFDARSLDHESELQEVITNTEGTGTRLGAINSMVQLGVMHAVTRAQQIIRVLLPLIQFAVGVTLIISALHTFERFPLVAVMPLMTGVLLVLTAPIDAIGMTRQRTINEKAS